MQASTVKVNKRGRAKERGPADVERLGTLRKSSRRKEDLAGWLEQGDRQSGAVI